MSDKPHSVLMKVKIAVMIWQQKYIFGTSTLFEALQIQYSSSFCLIYLKVLLSFSDFSEKLLSTALIVQEVYLLSWLGKISI